MTARAARFNRLAAVLLLMVATSAVAQAACIDAVLTGVDGDRKGRTDFRVNEPLMICFTTQEAGFVQVFDAPENGDFEVLYPNRLTHPGGDVYAPIDAQSEFCLGTPETFPIYHAARDGTGLGKVSIAFTRQEQSQIQPDEFSIPGQRVDREQAEIHLGSHRQGGTECSDRDVKYLQYRVLE